MANIHNYYSMSDSKIFDFKVCYSIFFAVHLTAFNSQRMDGTRVDIFDGDSSLLKCAMGCKIDSECKAVDWDQNERTCWIHYEDSACSPLVRAVGVTHVTKVVCQGKT